MIVKYHSVEKSPGFEHSSFFQEQSMKEKLQRAMNYKRAGLPVPSDIPLFRQRRSSEQGLLEEEHAQPLETLKTDNGGLANQRHNAESGPGLTQVRYILQHYLANTCPVWIVLQPPKVPRQSKIDLK